MTALSSDPIYLDHNATAPTDPAVREAMLPYLGDVFGNSRSSHPHGRRVREAVETAREQVAAFIGATAREIVFTSGGSEANNLALKGLAWAMPDRPHLVRSSIEHYAVGLACDFLVTQGRRVSVVGVDGKGRVDPEAIARACERDTLVVAVQHANNEIGTVQDIPAIARAAHAAGARLFVDAAQSLGKLPVDVRELGADLLAIAGHKFGGPPGVGALFRRENVPLVPLVHGAGHEDGLRSGTHATALLVGLGAACELKRQRLAEDAERMRTLRDRLHDRLKAAIPDLHLNGHPDHRLPHTLNVSVPGVDATDWLAATPGVAATTGAACHSGSREPSMALQAVGAPLAIGLGAIRLSLGARTTEADIDEAATRLVQSLRTQMGR